VVINSIKEDSLFSHNHVAQFLVFVEVFDQYFVPGLSQLNSQLILVAI